MMFKKKTKTLPLVVDHNNQKLLKKLYKKCRTYAPREIIHAVKMKEKFMFESLCGENHYDKGNYLIIIKKSGMYYIDGHVAELFESNYIKTRRKG